MDLKCLVDSNILIDHLNGEKKATHWLAQLKPDEASISVITRAEVLIRAQYDDAVASWLDEYHCLSIDSETADLAARLRREWKWKLPDAFQAALCEQHNLILVTRDIKDFGKSPDLRVKMPYKV
jgi:predicted nucleic acid-binding protein